MNTEVPNPHRDRRSPEVLKVQRTFSGVEMAGRIAICVYGFYALFNDAWPMDWIHLAQQSVFGVYSEKISLLIFVCVAFVVGKLLLIPTQAFVMRRWVRYEDANASVESSSPPPVLPSRVLTPFQTLRQAMAVLTVLIWVGGFAAYGWYSHQQRTDNAAEYRLVRLDDSHASVASDGDHLALQNAVVLAHLTLSHRVGRESSARDDYWLLPLVSSDWREGEPARWVVKVEHLSELPGYARNAPNRPWMLPQPLLVRVGDALPVTVTQPFRTMGVPLAADHHVLHVIASRGGVPLRQHTDYLEITLWSCSALSAVMLLVFALSAWVIRRRERGKARRSETP